MIVVRNIFQIKYGQAKPAIAAWKETREHMRKLGLTNKSRLLTDLVGQSYTMIHELEFESLAAFEKESKEVMSKPEWRAGYEKLLPYIESGSREIFNIVE